jgi:hypothetical protein
MPPGWLLLAKNQAELFWMLLPCIAATPAAKIGDRPTSGWNRQLKRSWMISLAGTS